MGMGMKQRIRKRTSGRTRNKYPWGKGIGEREMGSREWGMMGNSGVEWRTLRNGNAKGMGSEDVERSGNEDGHEE